jgi:hypothetical protein
MRPCIHRRHHDATVACYLSALARSRAAESLAGCQWVRVAMPLSRRCGGSGSGWHWYPPAASGWLRAPACARPWPGVARAGC